MACVTTGSPTYPQNNWDHCCQKFKCLDGSGGWVFPTTLGFTVVNKGSCKQSYGHGVFSGSATRCDLLAVGDPDKCTLYGCADLCADWSRLCGGLRFVWRIAEADIPPCGPFVGGVDITCDTPPPGWSPVFNCSHLDTLFPRRGWFTSSFQLYRTDQLVFGTICSYSIDDAGNQTGPWYYYDGDCVFQTGGTYTIPAGVPTDPPCPAGTTPHGCVCCRDGCASCLENCYFVTTHGQYLVDCAPDPAGNLSLCYVPITPHDANAYSRNLDTCVGDCGHLISGRDYRLAFCLGCVNQDDLKGCKPYTCPDDPKNYGAFAIRIGPCPTFDGMGNYIGCQPGAANDYVDWYCDPSDEEMVAHRAFVKVANGMPEAEALVLTGAKKVQRFRPCRCPAHDPACIFCHSLAYQPGYAETIDLRLAGAKTASYGFGPTPPLVRRGGPGTTLKRILEEGGLDQQGGCGCGSLEAAMNAAGPENVLNHLPKFAEALKANAAQLGHTDKIAEMQQQMRDVADDPTLDVYEFIIRQAVDLYRAENQSPTTSGESGSPSDDGLGGQNHSM